MKIEEFFKFAIQKFDARNFIELKDVGFVGKEAVISANFTNKKMEKYNNFVKMFFDCSFEFKDKELDETIGELSLKTEVLIKFDNNKKVLDLWKNDKTQFNKLFAGDLSNYVFIEMMPIVSVILQKMGLPVPIPSPFSPHNKGKT